MEFNEACLEKFYESLDLKGIFEGINHLLKDCNSHIISDFLMAMVDPRVRFE